MTPKLHLHPHHTPEEIASAAANEFIGLLLRRPPAVFGVALSGGRIAKPFYEAIVAKAYSFTQAETLVRDVHFFWADERCVPPSDPESNYRLASEHLFQPFNISGEQVHRIHGEVADAYAVNEAEAELCRLMPMTDDGQPVLDLVILGMGEDGHVASLFPEEPASFIDDRRVYRRITATKPPPERVTLGYQPLLHAREVWVLASGQGKAAAFQKLLNQDESLPISRVVARREKTLFFHDIAPIGAT